MTEQTTSLNSEIRQRAEQAALGQYLAEGELSRLRGVQEADLPRLAELMAQAPVLGTKPLPWTTQRLKQKIEDEKEPGMWGRDERTYAAVAGDGEVVGYVQATLHNRNFEFYCHVDAGRPDRYELGCDMVRAYQLLLTDWFDPPRIEATILEVETAKATWLQAAGFELEITIAESFMHQGRAVAGQIWGWVTPRVLAG